VVELFEPLYGQTRLRSCARVLARLPDGHRRPAMPVKRWAPRALRREPAC